jgi:hypothetical protein
MSGNDPRRARSCRRQGGGHFATAAAPLGLPQCWLGVARVVVRRTARPRIRPLGHWRMSSPGRGVRTGLSRGSGRSVNVRWMDVTCRSGRGGVRPGRRAALHGADPAHGYAPRADSSAVRPASPLRPQQRASGGQRSVWTTVIPNRLAPDSAHLGDQVHDIGIQKSKLPTAATDVFIGRRRRRAVVAGH